LVIIIVRNEGRRCKGCLYEEKRNKEWRMPVLQVVLMKQMKIENNGEKKATRSEKKSNSGFNGSSSFLEFTITDTFINTVLS
jgi:hypothetical protein